MSLPNFLRLFANNDANVETLLIEHFENQYCCDFCKKKIFFNRPEILIIQVEKCRKKNPTIKFENTLSFQQNTYQLFSACYHDDFEGLGGHTYNVSLVENQVYLFDDSKVVPHFFGYSKEVEILFYHLIEEGKKF